MSATQAAGRAKFLEWPGCNRCLLCDLRKSVEPFRERLAGSGADCAVAVESDVDRLIAAKGVRRSQTSNRSNAADLNEPFGNGLA